jgi:hypothetical protein
MTTPSNPTPPQPPAAPASLAHNVSVSLKAGGVYFAIANVLCVAIVVWAYLSLKTEPKTLEITGSARKVFKSDLIMWSGSIVAKNTERDQAYKKLKKDEGLVRDFLLSRKISPDEIVFSSIATSYKYKTETIPGTPAVPATASSPYIPAVAPQVVTTDKIDTYTLSQSVSIRSGDLAKVAEASRDITSLIEQEVEIDSASPSYIYTRLADLKVDMLAEATKDATTRALQITSNSRASLGKLVEAKMGVMQINPIYTSGTSGEGNNDLTSLEKEITAIVHAKFLVN